MGVSRTPPTESDAEGLAQKLAEFDATLSAGERTLFRWRMLATMTADSDVEGHVLDMKGQAGLEGLYFTWVDLDKFLKANRSPRTDPERRGSSPADSKNASSTRQNPERSRNPA